MVAETRHLVFRPPEVVQAVKEYHRRTGSPLPAGAVVSCIAEGDGAGSAVSFRIVVSPDGASQPPSARGAKIREISVDSNTLAAALILHCRDRRIPLPAASSKSLQRFNQHICLIVTINPKQEKLPEIEQMRL